MKQLIFLIGLLLICPSVWGTNYGSSLDGKSASITFIHTADCDSARAWFGYDGDASGDDTSNFYYSIKLLPCFNDDKVLMADDVGLDSIGTHIVKLVYFVAGPDSGSVGGIWLNTGGATDTTKIKAVADNNPAIWTDQASGSGTELCSLLVRDSNGQAVSGMSWTVKDSAGNDLGFDATNTAGWATFNIDQHDSVHLYPTERAGLSFATYYAEPVPANGFCDTLTGTIWNYAVGAAPLCNVFINARDYFYSSTGYSDWKLRIVFGEGGNYVDTVNNVPLGGYDTEIAVTDTGLVQQQVVVSCRALKYDRSTTPPAVVDSGFYMFELKDGRNKPVMRIKKLYIPCDSTQYNLGLIIRQ